MNRARLAAMAALFSVCWAGSVMATSTSDAVVLSRIQANDLNAGSVRQYGILVTKDGWGSVITNSSCATKDAVGLNLASSSVTPMWELATTAFSQHKKVIVRTADSRCIPINAGAAQVPEVTSVEIVD